MAKNIVKELKKKLSNELISETELENLMYEYGYVPMEEDADSETILKFRCSTNRVWIDVVRGDDMLLLVDNVRIATKEKGVETETEPFRSFEDLKAIQDYFWDNKLYAYWLGGWLMTSFGRRVNDIFSLKWSDIYRPDGRFREKLEIEEEKTGKKVGVLIWDFPKQRIVEYCDVMGINPLDNYNGKIFNRGSAAFRTALREKTIPFVGIEYPVSTHSYRKYFGNLIYKLHPNRADRLTILKILLGHSSEKITEVYIGDIDETKDLFVSDFSKFLEKSYSGEEYMIDNSPVITFRTQDLRQMVSDIYMEAKHNMGKADDITIINSLITMVENMRVR